MKIKVIRNKSGFVKLKVLMLVAVLLLPSACTRELNERMMASMIGIDQKDDGTIRMTMGFVNTNKQGDNDVMTVYATEGQTLFETARKFIQFVGKELLWPYIKVVVIGPSVAQNDVAPLLDFFNRNDQIQPNPYIVMSRTSAEEIVNLKMNLPTLLTLVVEEQLENQSLLAMAPQVKLYQFSEMMYTPGGVGYAALIKKINFKGEFVPRVEGMVVLKEGKRIGELNVRETRGVLWVQAKVQGGILVVPIERDYGKPGGKLSLEILGTRKASIKPILKGNDLTARIEIICRLGIGEVLCHTPLDLAEIAAIKQLAGKQIEQEIRASLEVAQEKWKTDVFGFSRAVEKKYPRYWNSHKEEWDEIFAHLPVDIKVSTKIEEIGLIESSSRK